MRRVLIFLSILALLPAVSWAQFGTAKRIQRMASAPSSCAVGDVYYNTATSKYHSCIAANTWGELLKADENGDVIVAGTLSADALSVSDVPPVLSGAAAPTDGVTACATAGQIYVETTTPQLYWCTDAAADTWGTVVIADASGDVTVTGTLSATALNVGSGSTSKIELIDLACDTSVTDGYGVKLCFDTGVLYSVDSLGTKTAIGGGTGLPVLSGATAPTDGVTDGATGQFYVETTTPALYWCTDGTADTWVKGVSTGDNVVLNTVVAQPATAVTSLIGRVTDGGAEYGVEVQDKSDNSHIAGIDGAGFFDGQLSDFRATIAANTVTIASGRVRFANLYYGLSGGTAANPSGTGNVYFFLRPSDGGLAVVTGAGVTSAGTLTDIADAGAGTGVPEGGIPVATCAVDADNYTTCSRTVALIGREKPMVGDSGAGGAMGIVPAPAAGDAAAGKYLKADGTWQTPAGSGDVSSSGTKTENAVTVWDASGNLVSSDCTITDGVLSCGDGTNPAGLVLPETTAGGGTYSFRLYGAEDQSEDGCIVVSGQPGDDQILRGTGTTATIDGKTCRVMAWEDLPSASAPATFFASPATHYTQDNWAPTQNVVKCHDVYFPTAVSTSKVVVRVTTADAENHYSIGITTLAGTTLASTAPFSASYTDYRIFNWQQGTVTIPAGWNAFCLTGDATTLTLGLGPTTVAAVFHGIANQGTTASANGVFPASISLPAQSFTTWGSAVAMPWFVLLQ